jgi:hypothetical protein
VGEASDIGGRGLDYQAVALDDPGFCDRSGAEIGWRIRVHETDTTEPRGFVDLADPVSLASVRKHGVADNDMLHAYRNPIRVFRFDDLVMLIGADEVGRLLEVGVATAEGGEFLVHTMPARRKFVT